MRLSTLTLPIAIAAVSAATACSSVDSPPRTLPATVATTQANTPIAPVDGTNKNKYNVGPFTLTMVHGIVLKPGTNTDTSEILVENTSNDFTGFANPEVQYTLGDEVIGTSNDTTSSLAPGQKQTLWIIVVSDRDVRGQTVDAQLTSVWFGTDRAKPGTRLQLAH